MQTRTRRTRLPALVLAAALSGLVLTGCGEDDSDPEPVASDSAAASTSDSPSNPTTPASPTGDAPTREAELIVLTEPAEGAEVSGSFTASGKANSPEANVPWEIRDDSGTVVLDGFSTATGWMDKLYPWTTDVDVSSLDPGTYTFVAMTDDPSGGEGKPAQEVGATIVVE
jgi:hypothetical protein